MSDPNPNEFDPIFQAVNGQPAAVDIPEPSFESFAVDRGPDDERTELLPAPMSAQSFAPVENVRTDEYPDAFASSVGTRTAVLDREGAPLATLDAQNISAWFGDHQVLDRVSLTMPAGVITA